MNRNSRSRSTRSKKSPYTVDGLKSLFNLDHSEELFGIEKEIPFQCPRIDTFIDDVDMMNKHILKLEQLIENDTEDHKNKYLIERECEILCKYRETLTQSFEELRSACDNLRIRGEGWKRLARNMFPNVPNNQRYIDSKFKV